LRGNESLLLRREYELLKAELDYFEGCDVNVISQNPATVEALLKVTTQ
jgi:hypothetical protein